MTSWIEEQDQGGSRRLTSVPTLLYRGHLATEDPTYIDQILDRAVFPYDELEIGKRSGGRRVLHTPHSRLMSLQGRLLRDLVYQVIPHPSSFAYRPGLSVLECASQHLRAHTVIRLDIADFFPSVKERWVHEALMSSCISLRGTVRCQLTPMEAFQLTVLCTVRPLDDSTWVNRGPRSKDGTKRLEHPYQRHQEGFLPQGAPTSGALSNLVMRDLDEEIYLAASRLGLRYTRYSDDMHFSSRRPVEHHCVDQLVRAVRLVLAKRRLHLNDRKTRVSRSGARRSVLGILVDGSAARLPRERHREIDLHLRAIDRHGIRAHAIQRDFGESQDLERHVRGLISWVTHVEPKRGAEYSAHLERSLGRDNGARCAPTPPTRLTTEEEARQSIDRLLSEGREYQRSTEYQRFLVFIGAFKQYAPFNAAMIRLQRPGARFVLTDTKWRSEYRRALKPDARPIVIMQPKGPYMVVFDVADTEPLLGAPALPRMVTHPLETFSSLQPEEAEALWRITTENAATQGIRVTLVDDNPSCAGSIRWGNTDQVVSRPGPRGRGVESFPIRFEIKVSRHFSAVDRYVTLVHELAHLYCGHIGADETDDWPGRRGRKQRDEIEAESCAYIVMRRRDDTYAMGDYLLGYFDSEGELPDDVSLRQVIAVSSRILEMGERRLPAPKKTPGDQSALF